MVDSLLRIDSEAKFISSSKTQSPFYIDLINVPSTN